ncbi:hypothetical protein X943_003437 [Babesia divergens]|uniref:Uncharacterized protein n=1 Tax=Babesia divergens TaxID=32595 RepID=A0AAD9GAS2_BABDI|nr:hypothetical protein X943_003437 [Babesia divergens]
MYAGVLKLANGVIRRSAGLVVPGVNGRPRFFVTSIQMHTNKGFSSGTTSVDACISSHMALWLQLGRATCSIMPCSTAAVPLSYIGRACVPLSQLQLPASAQGSLNLPRTIGSENWNQPILMPAALQPIHHIEHTVNQKSYIYDIGASCLFNKVRTDTKHRKRAFAKRGYFRQTRSIIRKDNRMKYAYALQGIDYEMLESLKMGEIPDINALKS